MENSTFLDRSGNNCDEGACDEKNSSITSGEIITKTTASRDSLYYDMNHAKQGLAYIFSHENFHSGHKRRKAADKEARKMKECLIRLGFEVHLFKDLKVADIKHHIQEARKMDHKDHNCFLVVVMSHGDKDKISAFDECYDPGSILWNNFTADKCPTLAGKPKLFFIQSCRGDKLDPGIKMYYTGSKTPKKTETDGTTDYKIPIYSDFCIMYSTAEGHFAFCNEIRGSFFITVLSEELEKHAYHEHLLTILTFVIRRVAVEFESNTRKAERNEKKQMPYFESSLTRLLQFVDKGDKQKEISYL